MNDLIRNTSWGMNFYEPHQFIYGRMDSFLDCADF